MSSVAYPQDLAVEVAAASEPHAAACTSSAVATAACHSHPDAE